MCSLPPQLPPPLSFSKPDWTTAVPNTPVLLIIFCSPLGLPQNPLTHLSMPKQEASFKSSVSMPGARKEVGQSPPRHLTYIWPALFSQVGSGGYHPPSGVCLLSPVGTRCSLSFFSLPRIPLHTCVTFPRVAFSLPSSIRSRSPALCTDPGPVHRAPGT